MTSSLVGSEMCIRDRALVILSHASREKESLRPQGAGHCAQPLLIHHPIPVSYTHLTLPTICSV
eukprot:6504338-Prorocentrum_lima.AAC.1